MICLTCGTPNADAARFCSDCGTELLNARAFVSPSASPGEITGQQSGERKREPDPLLGLTIAAKYRIDAKLGAGGMGAVYRATRLVIGDAVAVKILHSEQSDPRAAERFRREAQAAARLKHPNAVTIYDFGVTDDGLQYLVMELVDGESLRRIIKEQGPLTPSASAEIINQACGALDEAHRHNIIHRDIKPDNIIVDVTATGLRVKVLDFGIAKLRDDVAGSLTQTGSILGTPHYMSPEQCLGEELDSRSDIYGLGVVLYEMLTGRVPFNSPVSSAIVIQHVNQPPPSLRSHNVSIPPAVEAVVLSALEKRREMRPQTAGDLAQRFTTALRDGIAIPLSAQATYPNTPIDTPHSLDAGSSMPMTTLLDRPSSTTGMRSEGSFAKRNSRFGLIAVVIMLLVVGGGGVWFAKHRKANQAGSNDKTELNNNAAVAPNAISVTFSKNFAGLVSSKFKIEMKLERKGGELSGTYFYQPTNDTALHGNFTKEPERWADKDISSSRIDVPIKGTIDAQQNFSIEEFGAKGAQAGTFKGRFTSETEMEGTWSKPNGKRPTPFSLKDEGEAAKGGNYIITSKRIVRKKGKLKVNISYPQLEGLADNNVQKNFNERVRTLMNKDLGGMSDEEGTQEIGFSIDYRSGDSLSIIFGVFYDWTGAAHPQHHDFSYNYDLVHDREIKLADLFLPGVNYLGVISKLCAKDIATQKRKNGFQDIYEDGEAAAYDALKEDATFYPGETSLVFIFDPYQVGSFAEGYYVVLIPYSQLRGLINPNGPLAPFVS